MDEIRRLEQEIDELQNKLRHQNEDAARERSRILEQNRRSLEKYQSDIQRAIAQHDNETRYEYERLLAQYQHNLNSQVQSELSDMSEDYKRLMKEIRKSEEELLIKNQELERAIADLKNDISKRDEGNSREAAECQLKAVEVYRNVKIKPHEKFTPGRLKIFYDSIRDSQKLLKSGLFEASAAVAISAETGLKRLGFTIDDRLSEWNEQYDLFTIKLDYLKAKIEQSYLDWADFTGENLTNNTCKIEINYWSKGDFCKVLQGEEKYRRVIDEVNSSGKEHYMKNPDGATTRQLRDYIADIQQLDELLESSNIIAKSRYKASCERSDWGEAIIDFMQNEINLTLQEQLTGFREVSSEVCGSEDFSEYIHSRFGSENISEDMREWLRLVFENASDDLIYIYILPIESHGNVINDTVIHIDYHGAEQEQYSKDICSHVCEAINYNEESEGTVNYAADTGELKLSSNKALSKTGEDIERIKKKHNCSKGG